jgi:hypothetical protein
MFVMKVLPPGGKPKRGDLMQTNRGSKRERTWFVLSSRRINSTIHDAKDWHEWEQNPRYKIWRARWWELEPEMRMKLYRSAERAGGQVVWFMQSKQFDNLRRRRS